MTTRKRIILSLVLLSYFITAIDGSIVITGLTRITDDLHLSHEELSWVQNAYLLSFGGFMLMGGGLGDAFGRNGYSNSPSSCLVSARWEPECHNRPE